MKPILSVKKRAELLSSMFPGDRASKVLCTLMIDSNGQDGGSIPAGREVRHRFVAVPIADGRFDLNHAFNPIARARRLVRVSTAKAVFIMLVDERGKAIGDAEVFIFVNLEAGTGAHGKTSPYGSVVLDLPKDTTCIQQLYVYKPCDEWPAFRKNVVLNGDRLRIRCK